MAYLDFMSVLHKSTKRGYPAQVNEPEYPKAKAAKFPLCLTSFDTAQFRLPFKRVLSSVVS